MTTTDIDDLYAQHIKLLPVADRLRLLAAMARGLIPVVDAPRERSLLELEGLGAELWDGIDAHEYVNDPRQEWDHRP